MDITQRLTGMHDAKQLPSSKRSICGIDIGHKNMRIAGAVEDDELLGPTRLKSVVDNVFISDEAWYSSSRDDMMRHLNSNNVSDCCIGIPAYYSSKQRRWVLREVTNGGWRPCKLLHTTTAAALMYRFSSADLLQDDMPLNIAFIDMGDYQRMQVSIIELKKDQLKILSHAFDVKLSGLEFLFEAEFAGLILRAEFEKLSSILLERVREVLKRALNESGIRVVDIHSVQFIEKELKIPAVVKVLRDVFGKEPMETISESYPVVTGCFIHCAMLCGAYKIPKFQIIDILPYLIELVDGTEKQVLFPKGHPIIPSVKSVTFRRRSTFFINLVRDYNYLSPMFSYMIGPFDCSREKEVNVEVQLDLHGICFIKSAILDNGTILPVVEYELIDGVSQAETQKLLIDSSKHFKEFLTIHAERRIVTDKIIADDKIEKEKLKESNARLETTKKQHEKSQSVLLDNVQKYEKNLVHISAQHKESLGNLRIKAEHKLKKETNERQKLQESKDAIESQLMKYKTLQKQHGDLRTAFKNEVKNEVKETKKDLYSISAQIQDFLNAQDKIIADDRIEKEELRKSKVALELQLMETNVRLETTKKQHEEALREKVKEAENKLADISAELKDSLSAETEERAKAESECIKLQIERNNALNEVNNLREMIEWQSGFVNFKLFSLMELERATDGFNNLCKIGEGGFGSVYKGTLQNKEVAIKRLNNESLQGEAEFTQEVQILTQARHPNIISLIGASWEARAFIFEFAPNGSLNTLLTDRKNSSLKFDWQDRIRIASEICSGLIFLHSIPPHGIAHGDLKPDNILLDSNYVSKLCDFGISRKLQLTEFTKTPIHATEKPSFTRAYVDPEYMASNQLTPQSDTFSFGIILMQLVTGRKPQGIISIIDEALEEDKLDMILDGSAGEWPIEKAKQLAQLGLDCSEQVRRKRPDLVKVVLPLLESMKLVVSEPESTLKESFISESSVS